LVVVALSDAGSTETETPALPGDGLREGIVQRLRDVLGDGVVDSLVKPGDDVWVRVKTESWRAAGMALRDVIGCDYFCFLSAIDWMPSPYGRGEDDPTQPPPERDDTIRQGYAGGETRMQIFARVANLKEHFGVTIKADISDDDPVVDSWITVYAGANWHEREAHEMFGIGFDGHNDLRNMYLPMEFEGHPLRKDFPLLARIVKPWPGIVDVEQLPGGDDDDPDATEGEAET
jgi:NADH-quinone oxidoreductase subunit C